MLANTLRNRTVWAGLIFPILFCACIKLGEVGENFRAPTNAGTIVDNTPPSFVTGISFSNVGTNSLTVNWGIAADNRDAQIMLQYKLVKDNTAAANINSTALADAKTGGDLLMDWAANTTTKVVTSLTGGATYFFAVLVKDAAGNQTLYMPQSQTIIVPGTFDSSFSAATDIDDFGINADMAVLNDGKILIAANFSSYDNVMRNGIARLNTNGRVDSTFSPGAGAYNVLSLCPQSDGKIVMGGVFPSYNGIPSNNIVRIRSDGVFDSSFNTGTGFDASVTKVTRQSDGKYVVGGDFSTFDGSSRKGIARLNSDGSLDTTFNPGTGVDAGFGLWDLAIQYDGKIVIAGEINSFAGVPRGNIARLNTDGSLDTAFAVNAGADSDIYKIAVQADGKIVIIGAFANYNGTPRTGIARLNPDGNLDTTFDPGAGLDTVWFCSQIQVQSDGKIVVGGCLTTYNNIARNGIVRINSDGSLDSTFDPGTGLDGYCIGAMALQNDGKIIIGGTFESYNGNTAHYIARLWP